MALTEETEIQSALVLLAADPDLRQLFDKIVGKLEDGGVHPPGATASDIDWLSMKIPTENGHSRTLATLLMWARDASMSCPQWVQQIRRRSDD